MLSTIEYSGRTDLLTAAQNMRIEYLNAELYYGIRAVYVYTDATDPRYLGLVHATGGGPRELAVDVLIDKTGGYLLDHLGEKEDHGYNGPRS